MIELTSSSFSRRISDHPDVEFWENWYIIGENDPGQPEFKFVYYNGKTRQNTYEGAFVYSRSRELAPESMKKVYQIADNAGMNPNQFCKIQNGCFTDDNPQRSASTSGGPLGGLIASTKISQLLGVEPVAAQNVVKKTTPTNPALNPPVESKRAWWFEVGDYLENPHRHFEAMDKLRLQMDWPEDVKVQK